MKINNKISRLIIFVSITIIIGGYFAYYLSDGFKNGIFSITDPTKNDGDTCAEPEDFEPKGIAKNNPLPKIDEDKLLSQSWPYDKPIIEYKFYKEMGFLNGDLTDGKLTKDWSTFLYNKMSISKAKCIYKPGLPVIKIKEEILNGMKFYKVEGCCLNPSEYYYLEIPKNRVVDENKYLLINIDYSHGESGGNELKEKFLNVIKSIKFIEEDIK